MKKPGKAYYMISAVAQKYNIHPQTLRLYEREGLLKPSRTEGNTRLYSEDDLEQLETILTLTRDLGVNLAGVEVILTRLHAGAKFSEKSYRYSGGLHGVGVSVVNALSKKLQVWVRRDGNEYTMVFADGKKKQDLKIIGQVGKRNTGTTVRFWPDESFFDSKLKARCIV